MGTFGCFFSLVVVSCLLALSSSSTVATGSNCGDSITGYYNGTVVLAGVGEECNSTEQFGIGTIIEDGLNFYMDEALKGMGDSWNKVCKNPTVVEEVVNRRQLLSSQLLPKSALRAHDETARNLYELPQSSNKFEYTRYNILGRCRLCLPHNTDGRRHLVLSPIKKKKTNIMNNLVDMIIHPRHQEQQQQQQQEQNSRRQLFPATAQERETMAKELLDYVKEMNDAIIAHQQGNGDPDETVMDLFNEFLDALYDYVSFRLTILLVDAYHDVSGHCLYDEEPDVQLELTLTQAWNDPPAECPNDN